jgi:MFS family permease
MCAFGTAVFYVPQVFVTDTVQLLLCQVAVGFMLGGTLTSVSALLATLAPPGRQGVVYGLDSSAVSVANSLGPMLGAGIAVLFGMRPIFLFAAGVYLLGALAVARLVPESAHGRGPVVPPGPLE